MAYRTVTLNNGDTVQIQEGVLRGAGPEGEEGPPGPPGVATTIRGEVASYANLPVNPQQGDSYVLTDTGHLWSWDTILGTPMWVDAGRMIGPAGVESIAAERERSTALSLVDGVTQTVSGWTTNFNDPDPLSTGNTDPAFGGVLHTDSDGTDTVVWPPTDVYYLVTTTLSVQSSVLEPYITVAWYNTNGAEQTGQAQVHVGQEGGDATHVAVVKGNSTDHWQLRLTSTDDCTVTGIVSKWARQGGGSGPEGPTGPPPALSAGVPTKLSPASNPTVAVVNLGSGSYRLDFGLPQGEQGIAGSGYDTMNELVTGGDSVSDPLDGTSTTTTDQSLDVPNGTSEPALPWYFTKFASSMYRKLVGRLTTASRTGRTGFEGDVVYDTDTGQLYLGQNTTSGGDAWQIVPTIEYGTDSGVYHGASTERPDGSIYFKL